MKMLGKLEWLGLALYPALGALATEKPLIGALLGLGFTVFMVGLLIVADLTSPRRR